MAKSRETPELFSIENDVALLAWIVKASNAKGRCDGQYDDEDLRKELDRLMRSNEYGDFAKRINEWLMPFHVALCISKVGPPAHSTLSIEFIGNVDALPRAIASIPQEVRSISFVDLSRAAVKFDEKKHKSEPLLDVAKSIVRDTLRNHDGSLNFDEAIERRTREIMLKNPNAAVDLLTKAIADSVRAIISRDLSNEELELLKTGHFDGQPIAFSRLSRDRGETSKPKTQSAKRASNPSDTVEVDSFYDDAPPGGSDDVPF